MADLLDRLREKYAVVPFPPQPNCEMCQGSGEYGIIRRSRTREDDVRQHLCICCVVDPMLVKEFVSPEYLKRTATAKATRKRKRGQ